MRALIVEPDSGGHRLHFVRLLAEGLVEQGHEVVVGTSRPVPSTREWAHHMNPIGSAIELFDRCPEPRLTGRSLDELISAIRPDHVYVPNATPSLVLRGALLGHRSRQPEIEGLMLRGHFAYPASGPLEVMKKVLSRRAIETNRWAALHLLDPLCALELGSSELSRLGSLLVPEPLEEFEPIKREKALGQLGLPPNAKCVVLAGVITHRKGAHLLARAFSDAELPDEAVLVLAGQQSEAIRQELIPVRNAIGSERLVEVDEVLSEDEFWTALNAAEIIGLPYPRHIGSSGLLARAVRLQRRVIASNFGWIGFATRVMSLGIACNVQEHGELVESLETLFREEGELVLSPAASEYERFNSEENFKAAWTRRISESEGLESGGYRSLPLDLFARRVRAVP